MRRVFAPAECSVGKYEAKLPSDSCSPSLLFGGNARDETSRLTFAREWPTSPRYCLKKEIREKKGGTSIRINTEVDHFQM